MVLLFKCSRAVKCFLSRRPRHGSGGAEIWEQKRSQTTSHCAPRDSDTEALPIISFPFPSKALLIPTHLTLRRCQWEVYFARKKNPCCKIGYLVPESPMSDAAEHLGDRPGSFVGLSPMLSSLPFPLLSSSWGRSRTSRQFP